MPDYKDDISPELLEKITNSFKENISKKQSLKKLKELVEKGNATYQEAHSYAIGVGEAMADAFSSNLSADILPLRSAPDSPAVHIAVSNTQLLPT